MSEQNPSDATPSPAPVETPAAAPASPIVTDGFGASRGTGLARGKRPARPVSNAPTGSAPVAGYQPSALQVLVAKSEYVNPFAPEPVAEPAPAPAPAPAPVIETTPTPAPAAVAETLAAPVAEAPAAPAPVVVAPEPAPAPAPAAPEVKAELNILPPAAPRPATSWETPGAAAATTPPPATTTGADRPVFRIERKPVVTRDIAPLRAPEAGPPSGEPAPRRDGRDGRDGRRGDDRRRDGGDFRRDDRRPQQPRQDGAPAASPAARPSPAPAAKPAPEKSGGFIGWLKNIFGGTPDATAPAGQTPRGERGGDRGGERGPRGEGQGDSRRRRRGGRGRSGGGGFQGGDRGPRPDGPAGGPQGQPRPEGQRGPRPDGQRRPYGGGGGGGGRGRGGPRPDGPGPARPEGGDQRPTGPSAD